MKLLIASIVLGMAVTVALAGTTAADSSHAAAAVQMAEAGDCHYYGQDRINDCSDSLFVFLMNVFKISPVFLNLNWCSYD